MPKKLKKRADGRYVRVLIDPVTKKRTSVYGKSEREIERKLRERAEKEEVGEKFEAIANAWWDDIEPRLAIQSIRPYRPALRRAIEEFGNAPIKLIRPSDISAYLRKLARSNFAQKTISNYKTVISQIFDYAVAYGYADINPARLVKLPPDLTKAKRAAASPVDESIINAAADDEFLLPYIALMSGMRKGEILALQWKDIDFEKNIIDVSKSVCHEANVPIVKSPKTESSVRRVPLLIPLKERLLKVNKRIPNKYIISLDGGKTPLSETQYQRQMELYKARTGITCSAHMLRHSFATIAFEAGVPAKSVQEILGHRQLSTTMDIYTEFRNKAYDEAAEKLNSVLKGHNN